MSSQSFEPWTYLWDFVCAVSVVGIWPRYIEPNLLEVNRLPVALPRLTSDLQGLRILQFSDLHLDDKVPDRQLEQVIQRAKSLSPDLIVFTGDFLCYSKLSHPERLTRFLNAFSAPYGCYAILGNHDYAQYVGINADGEYDLVVSGETAVRRMVQRLFVKQKLLGRHASRMKSVIPHEGLVQILSDTPFQLLRNETRQIAIGGSYLNVCGLGEYTAKDFSPQQAFRDYDRRYPGIVLVHNPDAIPRLANYPGDLVLCGHTHGGQINLPWLIDRCSVVEYPEFRRGYFAYGQRMVNVNRGLGGVLRLRWRAKPELSLLTLGRAS